MGKLKSNSTVFHQPPSLLSGEATVMKSKTFNKNLNAMLNLVRT